MSAQMKEYIPTEAEKRLFDNSGNRYVSCLFNRSSNYLSILRMYALAIKKSPLQKLLEGNGCVFRGQERLDVHEPDRDKPCYCGRLNA